MRAPSALALLLISFGAIFSAADASTLDQNFNPPYFAVPDFSSRVLLLPNGKYVTYFGVETLADRRAGAITQYLADGTLDTSFNFSRDYQAVTAAAALPDNRLIVAAQQFTYGGDSNNSNHQVYHILRLNLDGTIDATFSSTAMTTDGAEVRAIAIQPDGKILVGGLFTAFNGTPAQGILRLLSTGAVDPNFNAVTVTATNPFGLQPGLWANPAIETDPQNPNLVTGIYIVGDFETVNGQNRPGIAKLNGANGTLDTTFQPSGFSRSPTGAHLRPIRGVVIQSNGKIVIGGRFTVDATFASNPTNATYTKLPLVRLNADGSADQSYGYFGSMDTADSTFFYMRALVIQPDDKVVGVENSVFRFNSTDGKLDNTFRQPDLLIDQLSLNTLPETFPSIPEAFTINLRSNGRILIGGTFSDVDDASGPANGERWSVAEFNSDGTLDSLKTSQRLAENAYPTSFSLQPDGSTLIGFNQTGISSGHSAIKHNFGRLLPNGSRDTSFDPLASLPNGPVTGRGFAVLPDGNIFGFGYNNQTSAFSYGVLLPDGTVADPNYSDDPNVSFDAAYPQPQTSNQVLISGSAAQQVVNNTELQRLNSNGSLDPSFALDPSILNNTVQRDISGNLQTVAAHSKVLAVYGDGRILFTYLALDNTYRLVRLNPNGAIDNSFQAAAVSANTTSLPGFIVTDPQTQNDVFVTVLSPSGGVPGFSDAQLVAGNKLVVVGQFTDYNGVTAHGIVRLNADGSVDSAFNAGNGAEWTQTVETASFHPAIDNIEMESDGQLLITGTFESFDGVSTPGIALLNSDGSVNASFAAPATRQTFDYHPAYLARQPDDSFLLSGPYSFPNQTQSPSFIHIFGVPKITSPLTATATVGQLFVYQVTASNEPDNYGATPIPANLSFNDVTGIIGGVPTTPGIVDVQVTAKNSTGTGSATLTITVQPASSSGPVIVSGTSVTARTGQPFSFRVLTKNASSSARLDASDLPPGLSVDPVSGIISGTPTSDGGFGVTLTVTDGAATTEGILQITCVSDPAFPVITSPSGAFLTPGQFFSYTITTPGDSDPSDPTSFSIIGALPAGLGFNPQTATISGIYTGVTGAVTNNGRSQATAENADQIVPEHVVPLLNETPPVNITGLVTHNKKGTGTKPLNYFSPTSTPTIMIAASAGIINEGESATFTFSTSIVDPVNSTTVHYKMKGKKAKFGTDYTLSGTLGQVDILAGESTATVTLTALTDTVSKEKNETVTMSLSKVAKKGPYVLSSVKKAAVTIVNVL